MYLALGQIEYQEIYYMVQISENLNESLEANRECLSIIEEQRNLIKQLLGIREEVEN